MLSDALIKVLFISTGLNTGGAEKMLFKLLSSMHGRTIDAGVVSLLGPGPVSEEIASLGVPVWHLHIEQAWRLPVAVGQLIRLVRAFRPDIIQGWMYHGNIAALLGRYSAPGRPGLAWGIRQSLYDLSREKSVTRLLIRVGAKISGRVDAIVYNSHTSRQQHEAHGYASACGHFIANGFDLQHFQPDPAARASVRRELGIDPNTMLIGLISRFHPMKGHEVFLQAAEILRLRYPDTHFMMVGRNINDHNQTLLSMIISPALRDRVHLFGERMDIPRLTAALDIASSSSWGEAFPNALGEAMSCAVPCVATDVGDVRRILGEVGRVVPVGDARAMAEAWEAVLALSPEAHHSLGMQLRKRVMDEYGLDRIAERYAGLYASII